MAMSTDGALNKLQELIRRGLVNEARGSRKFTMPTAYRWVPSVTSTGTASVSTGENVDAELERGPKGNRKGPV